MFHGSRMELESRMGRIEPEFSGFPKKRKGRKGEREK